MKTLIFTLFTVFLNLTVLAQCADSVNIYTFTYQGKTYEVVKQMKTWTNAAACAVERGGYLVEINSSGEQAAVHDAIINGAGVSTTYTSVSNGGGIAYVWIGATDQQTEGNWVWNGNNDSISAAFWTGQGANGTGGGAAVNGAYYNWGGTSTGTAKEPDNWSNQDHAAIGLTGWPAGTTNLGIPGEWNDIIGTSSLYFVIEYDGVKINNNKTEKSILIYPNPAYDKINLKNIDGIASLEISNILGKKVYFNNTVTNNTTIDISSLGQGLYFVTLTKGAETYTQKILVK